MNKDNLQHQLRAAYAAWLATERRYEEFARRWGLSYNALYILYAVARGETPVTQSRICEAWSLPKQTVHSVLQAFEKQGYVTSTPNPADRRNKTLELTASGQAFAETVISALDRVEMATMKRMTAEERDAMLHCNRIYHEYLAEAMEEEL